MDGVAPSMRGYPHRVWIPTA